MMKILRYIRRNQPQSRNAAHECVFQRYLAPFICQITENFAYKAKETAETGKGTRPPSRASATYSAGN
jgi:hypothetical protein